MDLGRPLLRGSSERRLRRRVATLPLFLERTFLSLTSSSSCEGVTAVIDWTIGIFVWVRLPNKRFHLGKKSSIHVVARPPNRRGLSSVVLCGVPQLLNVLTFMGGVDMGDGSDGSGDWGL